MDFMKKRLYLTSEVFLFAEWGGRMDMDMDTSFPWCLIQKGMFVIL